MIVLGALLAILLIAVASALRTSEAILLRGDEIGHLALFFIAASGLIVVETPEEVSSWALTSVALGVVTLVTRDRWFVIHAAPEQVREQVIDALGRIRVPCRMGRDRVDVALPTRTAALLISPSRADICSLRFEGAWRERRLTLARALLAKRFGTVLPAITIRIGGAR